MTVDVNVENVINQRCPYYSAWVILLTK